MTAPSLSPIKPLAVLIDADNASSKLMPEFDSRNYGYAKLSDLIDAIDLFDVARKDQHIQIRPKLGKS